jgi:hypothetical protein
MSLDCPFLLNVFHECLWIGHKTENENKKKYTAQKTKKMSNTDSNKIPGVNTVLVQEG